MIPVRAAAVRNIKSAAVSKGYFLFLFFLHTPAAMLPIIECVALEIADGIAIAGLTKDILVFRILILTCEILQ